MQSIIFRSIRFNLIRRHHSSLPKLIEKVKEYSVSNRYSEALEKFVKSEKILYNTILDIQKVRLRKLDRITRKKEKKRLIEEKLQVEELPVVLNQLSDIQVEFNNPRNEAEEAREYKRRYQKTVLPYSRFLKMEISSPLIEESMTELEKLPTKKQIPKNWLQDYELYNEAEEEIDTYGTPDARTNISNIPCYGCGALLHCKDPSIPGYLPSELYKDLTETELKVVPCQRCHFLEKYNTAISVSVKPQDYINIISSIKDENALMIVIVDLLDFPCSIFPNIAELVGKTRNVFIVGNKVDLIPRDAPNSLDHLKECLLKEALKTGFKQKSINHVALISAKTGYGIEELITKLHSIWKYRGNVYLVGCTNVGKSSLFNALLSSDYCKSNASNLIKRATASPWPGTTLKLLKFPILRPSDFRIYLRTQRLLSEKQLKQAEDALRRERAIKEKNFKDATLIGHIGRTFYQKELLGDPSTHNHKFGFENDLKVFNENENDYLRSKWCFDTPGVMDGNQILSLLTTDEIVKVLPRRLISPRMFYVKSGMSLFIGGLGRLDVIDVPRLTRLIVYASFYLPISIVKIEDADEFYNSFLGSEVLGVPLDLSQERLNSWPPLESNYEEIVVEGVDKHVTVCDVIMSSAGWIGINLPKESSGKFRAWTPGKRGIYIRNPSILPNGFKLRGQRVRGSPAYRLGESFTYKKNRKFKKRDV